MNELDYEATLYDFKERGRKDGKKEGIKEGVAKSKREIAEKLKLMGLSAEQIKEANFPMDSM